LRVKAQATNTALTPTPHRRKLALLWVHYCVRFDPERNLLLSSCLAGVIQYLNVNNGQSGTLLKLPDEVCVCHFELTSNRQALCCHCSSRPKVRNQNKTANYLQVWNYPALCKGAGLV
jgi:hypothetical protein